MPLSVAGYGDSQKSSSREKTNLSKRSASSKSFIIRQPVETKLLSGHNIDSPVAQAGCDRALHVNVH